MLVAICKGRNLGDEIVNLTIGEPVVITIVSQDNWFPGTRIGLEEVRDEFLRQTNDPTGEHPDERTLLERKEFMIGEHHLTKKVLTAEFRWPTGFMNTGTRRMDLILTSPKGHETHHPVYFDVTLQGPEDMELERMLKQQRRRSYLLVSVAIVATLLFSGSMGYMFGRERVRTEKIEDALAFSGDTICKKCPVVLTVDASHVVKQPPPPVCPPPPTCSCPEPSVPACPSAPAVVACPPPPTCEPRTVCATCEVCDTCEVCPEPLVYNECEHFPVCEEPFIYNECETIIPPTCQTDMLAQDDKKASRPPKKKAPEDLPPGFTFYH